MAKSRISQKQNFHLYRALFVIKQDVPLGHQGFLFESLTAVLGSDFTLLNAAAKSKTVGYRHAVNRQDISITCRGNLSYLDYC